MNDIIKKPLSAWLNDANKNSSKLSDINRSLSLAGIAIIWIFRNTDNSSHILPEALLLPLIFVIGSLAFDYLQYLWQAIFMHFFYRSKERAFDKGDLKEPQIEDVKISGWCPNIAWLFFLLKVGCLMAGYILIFRFLFLKL